MDIISKIATEFIRFNIREDRQPNQAEVIDLARSQLYDIDLHLDKIRFLGIILEANKKVYDKHLLVCNALDREKCKVNFAHESITYFLKQELDRLGVKMNEDSFTSDEKENADSKLDNILKDLEKLKMGQEIIYDELSELKELYFLGKKKWYQLLAGKCVEMVSAGIISETISKQIVTEVGPTISKLING